MNLNFDGNKIEETVRLYSKKKSMVLDLVNTTSWLTEKDKLFYGRESKNKVEITRMKTPFTGLLPNLIIVFKKGDFQNPKIRLTIFGYLLFSILTLLFLFVATNKILNSEFEGDLVFSIFLLIAFLIVLLIEFILTKRAISQLTKLL